eukprot:Skav214380  [mRNA]  locus=scaffold4284:87102:90339:- [translate_table: standard]
MQRDATCNNVASERRKLLNLWHLEQICRQAKIKEEALHAQMVPCCGLFAEAHLRVADDHDDMLSVAGGASVSWKDRARITMAARLKLLVEEHWGCALDELLEDLNPDAPRNLDKQPKSVQAQNRTEQNSASRFLLTPPQDLAVIAAHSSGRRGLRSRGPRCPSSAGASEVKRHPRDNPWNARMERHLEEVNQGDVSHS